jgi:hypothetical protein
VIDDEIDRMPPEEEMPAMFPHLGFWRAWIVGTLPFVRELER